VAGVVVVAGACGTAIPGGGTGYDCRETGLVGCCAACGAGTGAAAGSRGATGDAFRFFFNGLPQLIQNWLVSGFCVPHSPQNIQSLSFLLILC
jgi:hypothetical protein